MYKPGFNFLEFELCVAHSVVAAVGSMEFLEDA